MISSAIRGAVLLEFDQVLTCTGKRLDDLTFERICYALTNHLYVSLCGRILHLGTIRLRIKGTSQYTGDS
jgi:hypothetical protein